MIGRRDGENGEMGRGKSLEGRGGRAFLIGINSVFLILESKI